MKTSVLLLLSLLLVQSSSTMQVVPDSLVGRWRIGKPLYDMTPQPIGINAKQEHKLIGTTLELSTNSVSACGASIQITSVEATAYSADEFRQEYRIRPDQIGLVAPLTKYSFLSHRFTALCGSPEAFEVISDGKNAVLDVANDYFHLIKVKISR